MEKKSDTAEALENLKAATAKKAGRVKKTIDKATENKEPKRAGRPKGPEGVRVSINITTENHDYIKTMAKLTNHSMVEYINIVLAEHRKDHGEAYEQAKKIRDSLNL